jgi:hypothetical protein
MAKRGVPTNTGWRSPAYGKIGRVEHHVIPQFYLRSFRDRSIDRRMGPRLWVADFKNKSVKLSAPRGVVKLTNFYAIESTKGPNQTVEEFLRDVESVAAPIIERLRNGDWRLSDTDRADLANFMALLVVRTPAWRNHCEVMAGKLAQSVGRVAARHPSHFARTMRGANKGRNLSDEKIEELRQAALKPGALECRGTPNFSLKFMLSITGSLAPIVFQMSWLYAVPPIGIHLLSGDNPVFWYDPTILPPRANGLGSKNCILTFPIGPEIALFGRWNQEPQRCDHVGDSVIDLVNQRIIRTAERFVFATRREEAETALERRQLMEQQGESTGPREPDVRILEDISSE